MISIKWRDTSIQTQVGIQTSCSFPSNMLSFLWTSTFSLEILYLTFDLPRTQLYFSLCLFHQPWLLLFVCLPMRYLLTYSISFRCITYIPFYTWCRVHYDKCCYHLSPLGTIAIFSAVFPLLYFSTSWLSFKLWILWLKSKLVWSLSYCFPLVLKFPVLYCKRVLSSPTLVTGVTWGLNVNQSHSFHSFYPSSPIYSHCLFSLLAMVSQNFIYVTKLFSKM